MKMKFTQPHADNDRLLASATRTDMRTPILATTTLLTTICLITPAWSANLEHIKQLLATKQCQGCDLSGAGLVLADLSGADLSGANLRSANLSRANIAGADLSGANLTSASLYGANLSGAKLSGTQLNAADLRDAYLVNTDLASAELNGANLQGALGITAQIAKAEDFYSWGMGEAQQGDHKGAIDYLNQAISMNSDFAAAYLARSIAYYQLFNRAKAVQDAKSAEHLFLAQANAEGYQTAEKFVKELEASQNTSKPKSQGNFLNVIGGLASFLLKFLL